MVHPRERHLADGVDNPAIYQNVHGLCLDGDDLWVGTFSGGLNRQQWRNYLTDEKDSTSLPYNKVISIYEDSKKRLWFMTLGEGFCRYNPQMDSEIRTPLTLIKSPLENVLASQSVPEEIRDDLEIMDLNTNRLLDLVNQLLDFRKTETQGFQLNFMEFNATTRQLEVVAVKKGRQAWRKDFPLACLQTHRQPRG